MYICICSIHLDFAVPKAIKLQQHELVSVHTKCLEMPESNLTARIPPASAVRAQTCVGTTTEGAIVSMDIEESIYFENIADSC